MDSQDEPLSHSSSSRITRALTLGTLSTLALALAGLSYLRPAWDIAKTAPQTATSNVSGSRHLATVDFVSPATGWVVVEHQSEDFVLLRTTDAGQTWKRQLAGPVENAGEYMRFFDASAGVVVVLGAHAALYRTSDGGARWARQPLARPGGAQSAVFVDADHGWLLVQASTEGQTLLRTADGGRTWTGLGSPVAYSDWASRIVFSDERSGWPYSESAGPYAYRTVDGGTTWSRVDLPAPLGGWPIGDQGPTGGGRMLVAAQPTQGAGVNVTVDAGPYDFFTTGGSSPRFDPQPVDQVRLSSLDGGRSWRAFTMPASQGAIAYIDAVHWWWIGSGVQARSSDAGATWSPIRSLLVPAPLPESVQIIDSSHVWFGAMAGSRPLVESTDDGGVSWSMFLLPVAATS